MKINSHTHTEITEEKRKATTQTHTKLVFNLTSEDTHIICTQTHSRSLKVQTKTNTHTAHSPLIGHGHVRGGCPSQSEDSAPCVQWMLTMSLFLSVNHLDDNTTATLKHERLQGQRLLCTLNICNPGQNYVDTRTLQPCVMAEQLMRTRASAVRIILALRRESLLIF